MLKGKNSDVAIRKLHFFLILALCDLARQNTEKQQKNYSGLKCQLIFRAPNLLSCFDVSLCLG